MKNLPTRERRRRPLAPLLGLCTLLAGSAVAAEDAPTLFVAGDSTASAYEPNPKNQQGWGAVLQPLFDEKKLRVVDVARGGRSSRTFVTEGHWDRMLAQLDAGDFVDHPVRTQRLGRDRTRSRRARRARLRARGTIPGIGDESEEIDNVITGKHETVYTFGWYLRKMIADVRAKNATPILLTLTKTNHLKDGRIECPAASYRLWTWQTAQNEKTAFVDLSRLIADRYQREGPDAVKAQFIDDTVHTNIAGAKRTRATSSRRCARTAHCRSARCCRPRGAACPPIAERRSRASASRCPRVLEQDCQGRAAGA